MRLYEDLRDNAIPYFTKENGLKVRGGDAPDNRSGYAHGLMLMAKCAMWNASYYEVELKDKTRSREWFEMALEPLNALEEIYEELTEEKYPLKETQWRYKNTAESIFEIQHEYSPSGVRYSGNVAAIMTPKYDREKNLYDGVCLQGYSTTLPNWNSLRSTDYYTLFRPKYGLLKEESSGKSLFDPLPLTYDTTGVYKDGYGNERYLTKLDLEAWAKKEIVKNKVVKKIDKRIEYTLGLGNYQTGETFGESKT
jgi:hypothetical protein